MDGEPRSEGKGSDGQGDSEGGEQRFAYDLDRRFGVVLALLGVRPSRDGVVIGPEGLVATFGPFRLATPRANLVGAHITRGYRWWTAVGPRRSFVDDGLTFGTNYRAGVCIHFREKVPSAMKRSGHSALTVTVADLEGLAAAVGEIPG